jgi:hypothetical protein
VVRADSTRIRASGTIPRSVLASEKASRLDPPMRKRVSAVGTGAADERRKDRAVHRLRCVSRPRCARAERSAIASAVPVVGWRDNTSKALVRLEPARATVGHWAEIRGA